MSDQVIAPPKTRRRRRSRRRKLAESLALAVGVPALLFVVLALSVELIEYRPITAQKPDTSKVVPTARVEIPPVRIEPLRLHADVSEPINLD